MARVGYAPAGWTQLTEHLRGRGFTDDEILAGGLGTRARTGRVIDRLMFQIRAVPFGTATVAGVVGFVGRRNPVADAGPEVNQRPPKYLNTGHTLYTKGSSCSAWPRARPR